MSSSSQSGRSVGRTPGTSGERGGDTRREGADEQGPEPQAEPLRDSPLHPPRAESGDAWDAMTPAGNLGETPRPPDTEDESAESGVDER